VAYGAFDETVCTAPLGPISDEHEDAEYSDEHNDDDEMMLTLPSVA
jgi:hypothetical protein